MQSKRTPGRSVPFQSCPMKYTIFILIVRKAIALTIEQTTVFEILDLLRGHLDSCFQYCTWKYSLVLSCKVIPRILIPWLVWSVWLIYYNSFIYWLVTFCRSLLQKHNSFHLVQILVSLNSWTCQDNLLLYCHLFLDILGKITSHENKQKIYYENIMLNTNKRWYHMAMMPKQLKFKGTMLIGNLTTWSSLYIRKNTIWNITLHALWFCSMP